MSYRYKIVFFSIVFHDFIAIITKMKNIIFTPRDDLPYTSFYKTFKNKNIYIGQIKRK